MLALLEAQRMWVAPHPRCSCEPARKTGLQTGKIMGDESPAVRNSKTSLGSMAAGRMITGAADDSASFGNFVTTGSETTDAAKL